MSSIPVKFLYEQYGYTPKKIAEVIGEPETYVLEIIEEENLQAPKAVDQDTQLVKVDQAQTALRANEVMVQELLQPMYAATEALALQALVKGFQKYNASDNEIENAPVLQGLIKSFGILKGQTVTAKMDDKNTGNQIAIQIINTV